VLELLWNQDSTVLAVLISRETPTTEDAQKRTTVLQLWTMGNYYYYLKQEIQAFEDDNIVSFIWDPESSLRLYVLSAGVYGLLFYFLFYARELLNWINGSCRSQLVLSEALSTALTFKQQHPVVIQLRLL
jgi:hypothetical protein